MSNEELDVFDFFDENEADPQVNEINPLDADFAAN